MDDKKRLIVLMAALGLSLVGGGVWFFINMKGDEVSGHDIIAPSFSKINSVKRAAIKNINYIESSSSLINSFYKNEKYQQLEDNSVEIIIFGVGNSEPFAPLDFSVSAEEDEE